MNIDQLENRVAEALDMAKRAKREAEFAKDEAYNAIILLRRFHETGGSDAKSKAARAKLLLELDSYR